MLLEWLPSLVSWALSLLKAPFLNHLFLPANPVAQPHPKTSANSSIRALPIACLTARRHCSVIPQNKAPTTTSLYCFCPPPLSSSHRALNFILIFNWSFFFHPAYPLWSLIFVWSHCLCKDTDSALSFPHLLLAASINPALLCFSSCGVNLYVFVFCLNLLSFSCFFYFFLF